MKKNLLFLFFAILLSGISVSAQKIVLKSGSVNDLKGQQVILVKYDYSNLGVGKFDREEDYITQKVADYNKSEAGKGDKWKESWVSDRPNRFEPKFELLFNENMQSRNMKVDKNATGAKYEMLVHTSFIEPGFNIGITRKNAFINVEITIKDISSGKEIALITVQNCPGRDVMGYDFDTGWRIEEAYAKLGKSVAAFINKQLK